MVLKLSDIQMTNRLFSVQFEIRFHYDAYTQVKVLDVNFMKHGRVEALQYLDL